MRASRGKEGTGRTGSRVGESGTDAIHLVTAYFKQETIGPLKGLGRFVTYGIVGSLSLGIGLVLLAVGLLRLLQGETGSTFAGHLSWAPYAIVAVAGMVGIAAAAWRVGKGPAARRRPAGVETREDR
ncbi:MAG: hypothetical protein M0Z95_21165 [Actinomycetota bacterium]|jgi:predicted cobalt transporter CbtA|nr:hypothetical protein [Actinomycetota bacterium]